MAYICISIFLNYLEQYLLSDILVFIWFAHIFNGAGLIVSITNRCSTKLGTVAVSKLVWRLSKQFMNLRIEGPMQ